MNVMENSAGVSGLIIRDSDANWRPERTVTGRAAALPLIAQYISVLRRRRLVVLGCALGFLILGLLVTLLMTPQYRASATVEIQRETRNFTMVEGAQPDQQSAIDMEFYETQYGLLRADSLAQRVATQLRLYDSQPFFEMFHDTHKPWFEDNTLLRSPATRAARIREAAGVLLKHFDVKPRRLSRLVDISFTSPDAAFSKRVIDAWASNFVGATLERRFEATSYARKFLEQRLLQLRSRIDQSERQLVDYATREGIINLPASSTSASDNGLTGERSIVADDLASLNRELTKATADRVVAESRLGAAGGATTEALQNDAISGLRERRAAAAADYAKMMSQFEPDYPPAKALQRQIDQLDTALSREETRITSTLSNNYRSSLMRERELQAKVGQLKAGVLDLRRRSIQYNIYQRDSDTNRQLYDALLQRYKEIGVAGGVGVNNISVVDPADLPEKPSSPHFLINMVVALLAGVTIGIGLAFALEQIDEGLKDPGEVEKMLGVPLLGTIPKVMGMEPANALRDRKSSLSEAYLSLQTVLAFATDHGLPRTLAVTSTRPAEGKTTTSYALSRSLARAGRKTLLVDADMRSPSIHHLIEMKNEAGVSNYLSGSDELEGLVRLTQLDGLYVMTAGPQPPSAAELLSSDRLEHLIAVLGKQFDHVIFDAPPVMGLADAPLLGSRVEGMVFVMEYNGTKKSMARVAIDRVRTANAAVLGVVLTKFDPKRAHYGYGYNYGYGYGYGENSEAAA